MTEKNGVTSKILKLNEKLLIFTVLITNLIIIKSYNSEKFKI